MLKYVKYMISQKEILKKCINEIIAKVNWGSIDQWVFSHYETLSERIAEVSNIRLNPRTLKRLFVWEKDGPKSEPQLETKNALAIFLGYKDWFDYLGKNNYTGAVKKEKAHKISGILYVPIIIIVATVIIYFFLNNKQSIIHKNDYSFSVDIAEGMIPFTAKFHYDISTIDADSIFMQFGIMKYFYLYLPKNKHTINYTYKIPGIFTVVLRSRKTILDSIQIKAFSQGWEAQVTSRDNYYPVKAVVRNGCLQIPREEVYEIGNTINKKEYWTKYSICKNFGIDADNMTLEARIHGDSSSVEIPCRDIKIWFTGENGIKSRISIFHNGCSQYISILLGNKNINGLTENLSMFEQHIGTWNVINYAVSDKKVHISINNQKTYTNTYDTPMGYLYYIAVSVRGQSMIDYLKLYDASGRLVYVENFE